MSSLLQNVSYDRPITPFARGYKAAAAYRIRLDKNILSGSRFHTAQKVGSVSPENILLLTKSFFSRPVKQVQNSEAWVGRPAEREHSNSP